jgi:hypothetical protein
MIKFHGIASPRARRARVSSRKWRVGAQGPGAQSTGAECIQSTGAECIHYSYEEQLLHAAVSISTGEGIGKGGRGGGHTSVASDVALTSALPT